MLSYSLEKKLYVVSARHCYSNHGIEPKQTLYPVPNNTDDFFAFSNIFEIENCQEKYCDLILLEVNYPTNSCLSALDLSKINSIAPLTSEDIKDVHLRGFPIDNVKHEIDHDQGKINMQAFVTNMMISIGKSPYINCLWLEMKTPTYKTQSPNFMSGSPVYIMNMNNKVSLGGIVIEYNEYTKKYLVIESSIIYELVRKANN